MPVDVTGMSYTTFSLSQLVVTVDGVAT
eukprot:COSAG05_NODE_16293_length_349_cov_0.780000_2_plen_27_part_01